MNEKILRLKELIDASENIVFFGGAGVSTESGIPDFRTSTPKRKYRYSFETMLSHEFFYSNPEEFWDYYFCEIANPDAQPNYAHRFLASLEREGKLTAVVTQNIDGLHQKAGSVNVYELHGTTSRNYCAKCGKFYSLEKVMKFKGRVPKCECGGLIKPDVVLYGEGLDEKCVKGALNAISKSDLLIVGGTSLVVYPAAGFINYASGKTVLINRDHVPVSRKIDLEINGNIGETFKQLNEERSV